MSRHTCKFTSDEHGRIKGLRDESCSLYYSKLRMVKKETGKYNCRSNEQLRKYQRMVSFPLPGNSQIEIPKGKKE